MNALRESYSITRIVATKFAFSNNMSCIGLKNSVLINKLLPRYSTGVIVVI